MLGNIGDLSAGCLLSLASMGKVSRGKPLGLGPIGRSATAKILFMEVSYAVHRFGFGSDHATQSGGHG